MVQHLLPVAVLALLLDSILTMAPAQAAPSAPANRKVIVLFTGFSGSSSAENEGLKGFNQELMSHFGHNPAFSFSSHVFGFSEQQNAFDFITGFSDIQHLIVIGHSLGGDSVIELATDFLAPTSQNIDLGIQLDSVGFGDDVKPPNILKAINYYQISTGLDLIQGETFVAGAANINVEVLFGDPTITHTSIDDYPKLHDLMIKEIEAVQVPSPLALSGLGVWMWFSRKLQRLRRKVRSRNISPIGS
jgi:hypothetical protein